MDKCFEVIRDIAIAVAALWTAYTAHRGLKTWKKELNVKLGRDILTSLYRIRRTIEGIRMIVPTDIRPTFALLADEMDKLRAIADEAEVLWDVQIKVEVKKLDDLIVTLYAEHLVPNEDPVRHHKIMFASAPDPFGLEFKKVLNSVTEIVKLHFRAK